MSNCNHPMSVRIGAFCAFCENEKEVANCSHELIKVGSNWECIKCGTTKCKQCIKYMLSSEMQWAHGSIEFCSLFCLNDFKADMRSE